MSALVAAEGFGIKIFWHSQGPIGKRTASGGNSLSLYLERCWTTSSVEVACLNGTTYTTVASADTQIAISWFFARRPRPLAPVLPLTFITLVPTIMCPFSNCPHLPSAPLHPLPTHFHLCVSPGGSTTLSAIPGQLPHAGSGLWNPPTASLHQGERTIVIIVVLMWNKHTQPRSVSVPRQIVAHCRTDVFTTRRFHSVHYRFISPWSRKEQNVRGSKCSRCCNKDYSIIEYTDPKLWFGKLFWLLQERKFPREEVPFFPISFCCIWCWFLFLTTTMYPGWDINSVSCTSHH